MDHQNDLSEWVPIDVGPLNHFLEEFVAVVKLPDHLKFQIDVTPEKDTDEP